MTAHTQRLSNPKRSLNWPAIFIGWAVAIVLLSARALWFNAQVPLISDTDDAMRLTVARDLWMGQSWFDHIQHRLNVPIGGEIHWSRLVDVPLIVLFAFFSILPFIAEPVMATAFAWPLLLLLALLICSVVFTNKMIGSEGTLPAIILPILSAIIMVEFAPGRVDHHNVQIVLTLIMCLAATQHGKQFIWALVAGLAAASSLAIGTEALPMVAATIIATALHYVFNPQSARDLRNFGLTFSVITIAHLALAVPPAQYFVPACDALSLIYVAAALGVGIIFTLLSFFAFNSWPVRLVVGTLSGAILVAVLLLQFPQCLAGPYAGMDPWLLDNWLGRIIEAKPIWYSFQALPAYTLGIALPPAFAFMAALMAAKMDPQRRAQWLVLALFLGLGLLVMLMQVRGARLLAPLVAPAGAFAIVNFRQKYLTAKSMQSLFGMLFCWIAFTGVAVSMLATLLLPQGLDETPSGATTQSSGALNKYDCLAPQSFSALAVIPAERVIAPVDLGAHLLLFTPHSVVGAPYHRVQEGVLDNFNFFNRSADQALEIAKKREITLLVTCAGLGEMSGFEDTDSNALLHRLKTDDLPSWLTRYSAPNDVLQVYGLEY